MFQFLFKSQTYIRFDLIHLPFTPLAGPSQTLIPLSKQYLKDLLLGVSALSTSANLVKNDHYTQK